MKRGPNKVRALILASCVAMMPHAGMSVFAQSSTGTTTTVHTKSAGKKPTSIEKQMEEMRQQFQEQQDEIDQLKQQLQSRDQQLQQAQGAAQQAQQAAQQAQTQVQAVQQSSSENTQAYTSLKQAVQGVQADTAQAKTDITAVRQMGEGMRENYANPIALKYRGVYITPGGFLAAETVFRQRAVWVPQVSPLRSCIRSIVVLWRGYPRSHMHSHIRCGNRGGWSQESRIQAM